MTNAYAKRRSREGLSLSDGTTLIHDHLSGAAILSVPICSIPGPYGSLSLSLMWRIDQGEQECPRFLPLAERFFFDVGQRLAVSQSGVVYVDGLGDCHRFPVPPASGPCCDEFGSGLFLRQANGGYEVFDGLGFRASFGGDGRLLSIGSQEAGVAHLCQISYNNQGDPSGVSDPSGRSLSISYDSLGGCSVALPGQSVVSVSFPQWQSCVVSYPDGAQVEMALGQNNIRVVSVENSDGESLSLSYGAGAALSEIERSRGGVPILRRVFSRSGQTLLATNYFRGRSGDPQVETIHLSQGGRRLDCAYSQYPFPLLSPQSPYEEFSLMPGQRNTVSGEPFSLSADVWQPYADQALSFPGGAISTAGDEELRLSLLLTASCGAQEPLAIDVLSPSGNSLLPDGPVEVAPAPTGLFHSLCLRLVSTSWQPSLTLRLSKSCEAAAGIYVPFIGLSHVRKSGSFLMAMDPNGEYLEPQGYSWTRVRSAVGSPPGGESAAFDKDDIRANSILLLKGSQLIFADGMTRLVPSSTPVSVNGGQPAPYSSLVFGSLLRDGSGLEYSYYWPPDSSFRRTSSRGSSPFREAASFAFDDYCVWPCSRTSTPGEVGSGSATKTYFYSQDGLLSSERVSSPDGDMERSFGVASDGAYFAFTEVGWGGAAATARRAKSTGLLAKEELALDAPATFQCLRDGRLSQMGKSSYKSKVVYESGLPKIYQGGGSLVNRLVVSRNADGTPSTTDGGGGGSGFVQRSYDYRSGPFEDETGLSYPNGFSVTSVRDARGLEIERSFDGEVLYYYDYDSSGNLTQIDEAALPQSGYPTTVRTLSYDAQDRLVDDGGLLKLTYSGYGRVSSQKIFYPDYTSQSSPSYDSSGALKSDAFLAKEGVLHLSFSRDSLGRPTGGSARLTLPDSSYGPEYSSSVSYLSRSSGAETLTTPLPSLVSYEKGGAPDGSVSYTYDSQGRVSTVTVDGVLARSFFYDEYGRLVREDNAPFGRTYVFTYDLAGNLLSRKEHAYQDLTVTYSTKNYSYDVVGHLLSFGGDSTSVLDSMGNHKGWRGASLAYCRGHLVKTYAKGSKTVAFEYNEDCTLSAKTVSFYSLTTRTESSYGGGKLLFERRYLGSVLTRTVRYLYSLDRLVGFELNGETYLYRYDAQGSVIAVLSASNGASRATYSYDSFGKCVVTSDNTPLGVGSVNPIRFKGYYWDDDIGLYRLGGRLYDPSVGRFLQPDEPEYLDPSVPFGLNYYAYCLNDPVNYADATGHTPEWAYWLIGSLVIAGSIALTFATGGTAWPVLVGAAVGGATGTFFGGADFSNGFSWDWEGAAKGFAWGSASGAVSGAVGMGVSAYLSASGITGFSAASLRVLLNGASSLVISGFEAMIEHERWTLARAGASFLLGGFGSLFGKGIPSSTAWGVGFSLAEGSLGELFDYLGLSAVLNFDLSRRRFAW